MKLDTLRSYKYSGVNEPEPRYSINQTVFYTDGKSIDPEPLKVLNFKYNATIKVFQYEIEGKGYWCGEQSLVSSLKSKPLKLSEVIFSGKKDESGIAAEILASQGKLNGTTDIGGLNPALEFFQPDREFLQWIKEYVGDRLVVDVGCGSGKLTERLRYMGVRVFGVDPYFDPKSLHEVNVRRIKEGQELLHIISKPIEECGNYFQNQGDKVVLLFARPCHTKFIQNTLKMKDSETEALYITKPENLELYDDLGPFNLNKTLVQHKGWSVEEEVVYSIR